MAKQHILVNGKVRKVKDGIKREDAIKTLRDKGHTVEPINNPPTVATLTKYSMDGVARATDGCRVEPDGCCCHGHKSWLLVLGLI